MTKTKTMSLSEICLGVVLTVSQPCVDCILTLSELSRLYLYQIWAFQTLSNCVLTLSRQPEPFLSKPDKEKHSNKNTNGPCGLCLDLVQSLSKLCLDPVCLYVWSVWTRAGLYNRVCQKM